MYALPPEVPTPRSSLRRRAFGAAAALWVVLAFAARPAHSGSCEDAQAAAHDGWQTLIDQLDPEITAARQAVPQYLDAMHQAGFIGDSPGAQRYRELALRHKGLEMQYLQLHQLAAAKDLKFI